MNKIQEALQELVSDPDLIRGTKWAYDRGDISKDELRKLLEEGKLTSTEYFQITIGTINIQNG